MFKKILKAYVPIKQIIDSIFHLYGLREYKNNINIALLNNQDKYGHT